MRKEGSGAPRGGRAGNRWEQKAWQEVRRTGRAQRKGKKGKKPTPRIESWGASWWAEKKEGEGGSEEWFERQEKNKMTGVLEEDRREEDFMKKIEVNKTFHFLCTCKGSRVVGCE